MLWLALVFPDLAVECLPGLGESQDSWVLTDQGRVIVCNAVAHARGIRSGQRLSAAFALDPQLCQRAYDERAEQACLQALAEWALGYSAEVSVEGRQSLLLEVGSTQRYFGGLQALRERLRDGLAQRSHRWLEGGAPTPLAALWLARGLPGQVAAAPAQLREILGVLPVASIGLDAGRLEALHGAGIEHIAQLMKLPAAALARRFGPELPGLLRRALGEHPDPRLLVPPPQAFSRTVELAYPVHEVAQLMGILLRMIPDLGDWGWRKARLLTRIELVLHHERRTPGRLEIGFTGTRNPGHLRLVIEENLRRHVLQAAVVGITLGILESRDAPAASSELFPAAPSRLQQGQELLERLRARLGDAAVHGLSLRADHRPELAWNYAEPGSARSDTAAVADAPRPVWLLEQARDLGIEALPRLGSYLSLLAGPERIEGGWWDGHDIARDYFVASGPDGPRYWVYRERRGEGRWYLQGVFA